jgi:hypothetical protein
MKGQKRLGLGALDGKLIVGATLAGYDATPDNERSSLPWPARNAPAKGPWRQRQPLNAKPAKRQRFGDAKPSAGLSRFFITPMGIEPVNRGPGRSRRIPESLSCTGF